jgi:hypothetical protein
MFTLINLVTIFISLYVYFTFFLTNVDQRENAIMNKMFIFIFIFIINFITSFINYLLTPDLSFDDVIDLSVSNAIVCIIAFDVYDDLTYNDYFKNYSNHQKSVILIMMMIAFITVIKLIQVILTYNF